MTTFIKGTDMSGAHFIIATIGALATGTTTVLAAVMFVRNVDGQPWLDRLILVDLLMGLLAAGTGLVVIISGRGPMDRLHLLYGGILIFIIGAGRWIGRPAGRRQTGWIALSSAIALAVIGRLAMTG